MSGIRSALRGLGRNPAFTILAGLALAIGIGANTAVFSVVNAVLLRPLPYPDEDRVFRLYNRWESTPDGAISPAEHFDYLDGTTDVFSAWGVYGTGSVNLGGDEPERVPAAFVTAGVIEALGVTAAAGRTLIPDDDDGGGNAVVMISDELFRRRFGGVRPVDGMEIRVNGSAVTVVGVLPADFRLPTDFAGNASAIIAPLGLERSDVTARGSHYLVGVARLAPGVTELQAESRLDAITSNIVATYSEDYPRDMRFGAYLVGVREDIAGQVKPVLLLLLAAVGLVLLVVCANVASLTLTRADSRRREFAVRTALGAGKRHLVQQLLFESTILATLGGAVGVLAATWGVSALIAIQPQGIPLANGFGIDVRVLGFALAATLTSAVLFGLAPLLQPDRDPVGTLREGGRNATAGRQRYRLRNGIVAAELALAVVLLAGAGLLVRSFISLLDVDPGYNASNVLTTRLTLPGATYDTDERRREFFEAITQRIAMLPGVEAAGAVTNLPLANPLGDINIRIEGREILEGEVSPALDWQVVTPGYFDAIGMKLIRGRDFALTDNSVAPGAVIINEAAARTLFPDQEPIGQRFLLGGNAGPGWVTIVGIASDIRHARLDLAPRPEMYIPHQQFTYWNGGAAVNTMSLVVRSTGDPASVAPTVRSSIADLDPELPPGQFQTMEDVRAMAFSWPRFITILLGAFAGIAMFLAALGVYGLVAYTVGLRSHEMGIRLALGARRSQVISLVVRQGLIPVFAGLVAGTGAALVLTRSLAGILYAVQPGDPLTILAVATILAAVALLACYLPARRATRLHPMDALRVD